MSDREEFTAARDAGLRARHETRLERANLVRGTLGEGVHVERTYDQVHLLIGGLEVAFTPKNARVLARSLWLAGAELTDNTPWPGSNEEGS